MVKQHCLITGSSGFLGKHLSRVLEQKGYVVHKFDRTLLNDYGRLCEYLLEIKPDYIYNLMGAGNISGVHTRDEIWDGNLDNLQKLLMTIQDLRLKVKGLVNYSSLSVKLSVKTDYSNTKYLAEVLCQDYAARGMPCVSIRPATIIGNGDNEAHLVPTIFRRLLNKEILDLAPLPVHDYLDVQDLVEATILICESAKELSGKTLEVGSGKQHSNQEIVNLIEKITGKDILVNNTTIMAKSYDTKDWTADLEEVSKLGWKPKITLEQSLKNIWQSKIKT